MVSKPSSEESTPAEVILGEMGVIPPLLPEGEHIVAFIRAEQGQVGARDRWFLWFRIVDGEHMGVELYLSCAWPKNGRRTFGLSSKLVSAVTVATGQTPRRRDRISTRVFAGKYFMAKVRTVTTDYKKSKRSPDAHYSVIDELLSVTAGAPSTVSFTG